MSRHPYTYADDYVRALAGYNASGTILSRAEASLVIEGIAKAIGMTHEELAVKLSEYYQRHQEEIAKESAAVFISVMGKR